MAAINRPSRSFRFGSACRISYTFVDGRLLLKEPFRTVFFADCFARGLLRRDYITIAARLRRRRFWAFVGGRDFLETIGAHVNGMSTAQLYINSIDRADSPAVAVSMRCHLKFLTHSLPHGHLHFDSGKWFCGRSQRWLISPACGVPFTTIGDGRAAMVEGSLGARKSAITTASMETLLHFIILFRTNETRGRPLKIAQ